MGKDIEFDQQLVGFDCQASIAHAQMLCQSGLLSAQEFNQLKTELQNIIQLNKQGQFQLTVEDEDCHTKIENHLTEKLGATGKKIHLARSRNDQVLVALRLYSKKQLAEIHSQVLKLAQAFLTLAKKHEFTVMPGYTHMQKAMPSSVGLWAGAFTESLLDDLQLIEAAFKLNDQNPLGSAAGFGAALETNRELTAKLLGFKKVQNNSLYVQNSRGKIESAILSSLLQVMLDLNKLATDLLLYSLPELGFFSLPKKLCTGSSIMPQKNNPDVLEILRANSGVMQSLFLQCVTISNSLPSGYNRDLQLTKQPLMQGLELALASLKAAEKVVNGLEVNEEKMLAGCQPEMLSAEQAMQLSLKGMPFRDAYKKAAEELPQETDKQQFLESIKSKIHVGATGNLGLEKLEKQIQEKINAGIPDNT